MGELEDQALKAVTVAASQVAKANRRDPKGTMRALFASASLFFGLLFVWASWLAPWAKGGQNAPAAPAAAAQDPTIALKAEKLQSSIDQLGLEVREGQRRTWDAIKDQGKRIDEILLRVK